MADSFGRPCNGLLKTCNRPLAPIKHVNSPLAREYAARALPTRTSVPSSLTCFDVVIHTPGSACSVCKCVTLSIDTRNPSEGRTAVW